MHDTAMHGPSTQIARIVVSPTHEEIDAISQRRWLGTMGNGSSWETLTEYERDFVRELVRGTLAEIVNIACENIQHEERRD